MWLDWLPWISVVAFVVLAVVVLILQSRNARRTAGEGNEDTNSTGDDSLALEAIDPAEADAVDAATTWVAKTYEWRLLHDAWQSPEYRRFYWKHKLKVFLPVVLGAPPILWIVMERLGLGEWKRGLSVAVAVTATVIILARFELRMRRLRRDRTFALFDELTNLGLSYEAALAVRERVRAQVRRAFQKGFSQFPPQDPAPRVQEFDEWFQPFLDRYGTSRERPSADE